MIRLFQRLLFALMALWPPMLLAEAAAPVTVRDWDASARLFVIQDSNVPLAGNGSGFAGSTKGPTFGLALNGSKDLHVENRGWRIALVGSATHTFQSESALRNFDVASLSGGLSASRNLPLGSLPSKLTLGYQFSQSWLGGSGFSTGHTATVDVGVQPSFSTNAGAFVAVGYNQFNDQGPYPAVSSRDAVSYRTGLRGMVTFNGNRQAIQATLAYMKNDAKGANFTFAGPSSGLQFISYLVGPWAIAASANYSSVDYTTFAVVPRRENRVTDYRLTVYGPLTHNLSADVSIGHSYYQSNQQAFEAKRQSVSLGLSYIF